MTQPTTSEHLELRRDESVWGSFMWGSADVGADITAALFATASAGTMNFFLPSLIGRTAESFAVRIGPSPSGNPLWPFEALVLIAFLVWLNIRGVRERSFFNGVIGPVDIVTDSGTSDWNSAPEGYR